MTTVTSRACWQAGSDDRSTFAELAQLNNENGACTKPFPPLVHRGLGVAINQEAVRLVGACSGF